MDFLGGSIHEGNLSLDLGMFLGYARPLDIPFFFMKQHIGWIKLHRQFLEWEWYDEPNCLRVFLHCLLRANHKDNKYRGDLIKRGTFVSSLDVLAFELKMGKQSLRTALNKLKKTGEINTQTNTRGTVVIICNYDTYQSIEP